MSDGRDVNRRVRRLVARGAIAAMLAGPTALAFFAGGYFAGPRSVATVIAWGLAGTGMLITRQCSNAPAHRGRRLAVVALGLFTAWTFLSATWAPIPGHAIQRGEIALLYLGAFLAAATLLQTRERQRLIEPTLAAGALLVILYGLSERFLPGLLHFARTSYSQGRLEQPLTYWNAEGEVAAIGLVLCVRMAGDTSRPRGLRIAAAAACGFLGMGLYLSVSRGALFAAVAGIATLIVAAPHREQLRAVMLCCSTAVLAALAAALTGLTNQDGSSLFSRERHGLLALVLLVALTAAVTLVERRLVDRTRIGNLRLPRRAGLIAATLICAGLAVAIMAGAAQPAQGGLSGGADRLIATRSIRFAYWRVAVDAFAAEPVHGVGAAGWAVRWLQDQPSAPAVQDAHSLPLQTLAELGIVGAGLLIAFVSGVALAARDVLRWDRALAAGPIAACVVYLAHSPLDWDWEMPALTLIAVILAGGLLACCSSAASRVTSD